MTKRLLNSGAVSMIVSEEDENVIYPVRLKLFKPVVEEDGTRRWYPTPSSHVALRKLLGRIIRSVPSATFSFGHLHLDPSLNSR